MKNSPNSRSRAVMLLCMLITTASNATFAKEGSDEKLEDRSKRCVSLARIKRTDVVDDQNILFYMNGRKVYLNKLPHKCHGLARADAFMYRTSMSQLCDLDIITVLDNIGFGFMRGPSCGLGTFYPIDKERAKELKGQKAPGSERIEPVEE